MSFLLDEHGFSAEGSEHAAPVPGWFRRRAISRMWGVDTRVLIAAATLVTGVGGCASPPQGFDSPDPALIDILRQNHEAAIRGRDVQALHLTGRLRRSTLRRIGLYPTLLLSTLVPDASITADAALSAAYGLSVALAWWPIAVALAFGYVVFTFRSNRERVRSGDA